MDHLYAFQPAMAGVRSPGALDSLAFLPVSLMDLATLALHEGHA